MFALEIIEFDDALKPRLIERYFGSKGPLKKESRLFRWTCIFFSEPRSRVFFARRLTTYWAADARRFRFARLLVFLKLAVWNDDRIVSNRTHACRSRSARCPPNTWMSSFPPLPPRRGARREESDTPPQL